jgi:tetratricopeptide (TPR) repeat protein
MIDSSRLLPATLLAGLLAVGAMSSPAHAQGGGFQRHLTAAIRLYESLEYERALKQIELARDLPHSSQQEIELSLYEGIILADLGRQDSATAAFKSALLVEPDTKLPVKVAPKVQKLFESVRAQVKRELAALPPRREPEPPKVVTPPPPQPPAPGPATTPAADPLAVSSEPSRPGLLRRHALIPAIAGGTLVVAGGVSWAISRGEASRLRNDDPEIQSVEDVNASVSKGRTWQTLGVTLLGVGTAGLATAASIYLLGAPEEPVAVGLGTDGTSAFVYGRWP